MAPCGLQSPHCPVDCAAWRGVKETSTPPGPLDRRQGAPRKITAQGVARSDIGDAPQARPLTVILARSLACRERRLLAQAAAEWHHHLVNAVENGLIIVRNRRSTSRIFYASPTQPSAAHDPSLVSHRHLVGCCRSPGNLASLVTRSIGECRMSLWSTLVVSLRLCGMPVNIRDGGPLAPARS